MFFSASDNQQGAKHWPWAIFVPLYMLNVLQVLRPLVVFLMELRGWILMLIILNNIFKSSSTSGGSKPLPEWIDYWKKKWITDKRLMKFVRRARNNSFTTVLFTTVSWAMWERGCLAVLNNCQIRKTSIWFFFSPSTIKSHKAQEFGLGKYRMLKSSQSLYFPCCVKIDFLSSASGFLT